MQGAVLIHPLGPDTEHERRRLTITVLLHPDGTIIIELDDFQGAGFLFAVPAQSRAVVLLIAAAAVGASELLGCKHFSVLSAFRKIQTLRAKCFFLQALDIFSFACQKRTRKAPAASEAREATGCGSQRLLRPLSGPCILLAAAPTAPPCFRRRRRSSPLQIRGCSPLMIPKM